MLSPSYTLVVVYSLNRSSNFGRCVLKNSTSFCLSLRFPCFSATTAAQVVHNIPHHSLSIGMPTILSLFARRDYVVVVIILLMHSRFVFFLARDDGVLLLNTVQILYAPHVRSRAFRR